MPVPAPGPQVIDQPAAEPIPENESTGIDEPASESTLVNEPTDIDEPASELIPANQPTVSNETALEPMPTVEIDSATGDLLAAAALAMTEQRFLQPQEDNARYWYRQVLDIQPDNPIALRGLRQVSDTFVRRAEAAFRAGNPAEAAAALTLAADTDARNPSIEIVNYMLVSQGDQLLADARAAALAGDPAATAVLLAKAEEYAHIDEAVLRDVGDLLATALEEQELRGRIAAVDEHISDGRLLAPDGENAHTLLLELVGEIGNDERLLYTTDRLAQGLLTSASVSMATGDADAAAEYLDAVDALAFVTPEVATARSSLRTAIETAASTATAGAASEPVPASAPAESAPVRRQLISELGIDRYVAPKYPRSARRRGISGFVEVAFTLNPDGTTGDVQAVESIPREVFDKSAEEAVRQWRFKPREQAASARIVLSFQLEP